VAIYHCAVPRGATQSLLWRSLAVQEHGADTLHDGPTPKSIAVQSRACPLQITSRPSAKRIDAPLLSRLFFYAWKFKVAEARA